MHRQLIFVAGPLSAADPERVKANVMRAIDAGNAIHDLGHLPVVPHLNYFSDERAKLIGQEIAYEQYMRLTLGMLACCDALFYLGSSPGADRELGLAQVSGLTIYRKLDEIEPYEEGTVTNAATIN